MTISKKRLKRNERQENERQQQHRLDKVQVRYVSDEQKEYMAEIWRNTVTLCHGPAGTGKTHIAIAAAINHLIDGKVSKVVIARPAITAGKDLGAMPGNAVEKVRPYVQPALDMVFKCQSNKQWMQWALRERVLEIIPVELMRGMNFEDCFAVVDEAQNLTPSQFKMCITRICRGSKMVLTGDTDQSDMNQPGGFGDAMLKLKGVQNVSVTELTMSSMARDPVVAGILDALKGKKSPIHHDERPNVLSARELSVRDLSMNGPSANGLTKHQ